MLDSVTVKIKFKIYILTIFFVIFREECETEERKRPHQLRTHLYCWCDKESLSQYSCVSNKHLMACVWGSLASCPAFKVLVYGY